MTKNTYRLPELVDMEATAKLLEEARSAMPKAIDIGKVERAGTAAIQALMVIARGAKEQGTGITLKGESTAIANAAEDLGIDLLQCGFSAGGKK